MDDLSLLREGVREAIKDICESSDGLIFIKRWHTIRAELVRLMRDLKSAESERDALQKRIAEAARAYHSSFEYTLDASTLYARATGIPGEETYALVKVED